MADCDLVRKADFAAEVVVWYAVRIDFDPLRFIFFGEKFPFAKVRLDRREELVWFNLRRCLSTQ